MAGGALWLGSEMPPKFLLLPETSVGVEAKNLQRYSSMKIEIKGDRDGIRCFVAEGCPVPVNAFPLKFAVKNIVTGEDLWSCHMQPGTWASYPSFRDLHFTLHTSDGVLLREKRYSYVDEDLEFYEFWDLFCRTHSQSVGLVLGAGNGKWGEWVSPVIQNAISCHLVEGDVHAYEQLEISYRERQHISTHNLVVTEKGGEVRFYEHPYGKGSALNTTNLEYMKKVDAEVSDPSFSVRSSVSLAELLENIGRIDWMRVDLEGIDADLILSLPVSYLISLTMIQFEHEHVDPEKLSIIDGIFLGAGYKKFSFELDTTYLRDM